MKTKDRPTKRKLPTDASVECDQGAVCKKQRPLSPGTLSVNGTVNVAIGSLQPPVMPIDFTCSLNQVPPIGNTSSKLVANVNYSNGHPIGEQNNCIKANIRRTSVGINVAPNVTTNGKHVSTAIERLRFRKRKNPDSTVPYQSQRVIRQLISEKITSASRYSGNRQHTHLPNATKQIIVDDNCCKKQQLMKEKQQNFLTDKCSSLVVFIHSWRILFVHVGRTIYMENLFLLQRIPLEYSHLGDRDGSDLRLRTVLTTSFIGGLRYMYAHYLDALAICRVHGRPFVFITFTCNAKWPDIEEFMEPFPQLTTEDRADIVDHVFEKKVRDYVNFVRDSDTFGDVTTDPMNLWQRLWKDMSDEIPRMLSKSLRIPEIERNEKKMKATVLFDLEAMLNSYSKSLKDFGLPPPPEDMIPILQNRFLMEETNYNPEHLLKERNLLIPRLNEDQTLIFDEITSAVKADVQKLIFVYRKGGTGKIFLWKAITSTLWLEEKIVLAVGSSGIASLLLPSGPNESIVRWLLEALTAASEIFYTAQIFCFGGQSIIMGEMAEKFDMNKYAKLEKLVIIAVIFAWATKRFGEANHILSVYTDLIDPTPALEIQREPYNSQLDEQMRNCYTIESLLSVNPQHYQAEGQKYIFQYRFGKKARPGNPNFTLDVVLKATAPPLLALPSAETITSPVTEVLEQPSSSNKITPDTEEPSLYTKDNVEERIDNPEGKKKIAKRTLFQ
ncbi:DNA helicase [Tanacetum coccineum]